MRNKIGLEEHYVMSRSDVAPMGAAGATEEWIDRIY
ncbi:hypothetical protein PsAD37_03041 [Pseudovibrio sp. Ad37]|nr:hypothetical protein PsWM33_05401 [Pseudovibrio sp. WM33]KZL23638.1 hypothetical protein PsAD37_03041 [Pseudovibrio sp. Ad37]